MSASPSAIVQLTIFGHVISLIGRYASEKGMIFILDISNKDKQLLHQYYDDLSDDDQKLVTKHFDIQGNLQTQLNEQYGKETDWKTKLINLFHRVHIDNVALYRDAKVNRTFVYVSLLINLKGALQSSDGNFALEFISIDFTIASGSKDKEINPDNDEIRKQDISQLQEEFLGHDILQNRISKASLTMGQMHTQLQEGQKRLTRNHQILRSLVSKLNKRQTQFDQLNQQFKKKANDLERLKHSLEDFSVLDQIKNSKVSKDKMKAKNALDPSVFDDLKTEI